MKRIDDFRLKSGKKELVPIWVISIAGLVVAIHIFKDHQYSIDHLSKLTE